MYQPINLLQHPEGGMYREIFRSPSVITTAQGTTRSALTHIYFSLKPGEVSRFHKVSADEVWNLYQGTGVRIYQWDGTENAAQIITLSVESNCFCHIVPAGYWQATEPIADTILAGCSVAPGFEFADFELIQRESSVARRLLTIDPSLSRFI